VYVSRTIYIDKKRWRLSSPNAAENVVVDGYLFQLKIFGSWRRRHLICFNNNDGRVRMHLELWRGSLSKTVFALLWEIWSL